MEPPSSPSSNITAPPDYRKTSRRLAKLIVEAMTCRFALLHYDSTSKSMIKWYWPVDSDGKKIPPSHLEKYRNGHDFKYLCCLCADGGGKGVYVETAVYSWWNEIDKKIDWTARCASDTCGYRGTFQYPQRDTEQRILPIRLEWDRREQAELLDRLDCADGEGVSCFIQTLQKMRASRSKASDEPPYLFGRSTKEPPLSIEISKIMRTIIKPEKVTDFVKHWYHTPIPRVEQRSLDAGGALGLILHYLNSTMHQISLQQTFTLIQTTVSWYLSFGLHIHLQTTLSCSCTLGTYEAVRSFLAGLDKIILLASVLFTRHVSRPLDIATIIPTPPLDQTFDVFPVQDDSVMTLISPFTSAPFWPYILDWNSDPTHTGTPDLAKGTPTTCLPPVETSQNAVLTCRPVEKPDSLDYFGISNARSPMAK
ncbi:uncharacterized protein F5147DRAFT_656396 [Suillus discolor]|uniref:Uncharacterized protein n=1 Tax=Suillus discolor TaxID=1912936 RepID=A0A9P7JPZ7_9AGAM|nr:uncharacterized protein F5147DRAFT_656396 [Suillus discolor]KAG2097262.1 hypothetical protein F5147DRAFT_656396 [Suillus discolor]